MTTSAVNKTTTTGAAEALVSDSVIYSVSVYQGQNLVWNDTTSVKTCQPQGLQPGRTYTWRVEAIGEGGTNVSSSWSFTTQQQLPARSNQGLLLLIIVLTGLGVIVLAKRRLKQIN